MWKLIPGFEKVFGLDLTQPVLSACIFKLFGNFSSSDKVDIRKIGTEFVSTLFFSVQPDHFKTSNEEGVVPKASKFKKTIVQSCIYHVQNDTFSLFSETVAPSTESNAEQVNNFGASMSSTH